MIRVNNVSKCFGRVQALAEVSVEIAAGECFCLLGRNGAGKSTLINVMSGLAHPDTGEVRYGDLSLSGSGLEVKRTLGVLPDRDPTVAELTGLEYLELVALLHGLSWPTVRGRAMELSEQLLELQDALPRRIGGYSRGMRTKLGLCAALLHEPRYVLLDEPFSSMDPLSAARLRDLIGAMRAAGSAILLSSHDLGQVERVADRIGVLDRGELLFVGTPTQFSGSAAGSLERSLLDLLGARAAEPSPLRRAQ